MGFVFVGAGVNGLMGLGVLGPVRVYLQPPGPTPTPAQRWGGLGGGDYSVSSLVLFVGLNGPGNT